VSIQPIRLKFYVKNYFQILQEGVEKSVTYMSYGLERVKDTPFIRDARVGSLGIDHYLPEIIF